MKRLLSILLLMAFMLPFLNRIWIVVDFKINQDFIARVLCINKSKPITVCNGKCYLADQLRKAREKENKKLPANLEENIEITLFSEENRVTVGIVFDSLVNSTFFDPKDLYVSSYLSDIFRPPSLLI